MYYDTYLIEDREFRMGTISPELARVAASAA